LVDLSNGMVIDPAAFGVTPQFNIRADVDAKVQSVLFSNGRAESVHPYTYCGDPAGQYNVCPDLVPGASVAITARGHTGKFLTGTVLPEVKVSFSIKANGGPMPTVPQPVPVPVPVPVPTPSPPFTPILINSGGLEYMDTQGRIWGEDRFFTGGMTYVSAAADISQVRYAVRFRLCVQIQTLVAQSHVRCFLPDL
jgi:hypothetical protein